MYNTIDQYLDALRNELREDDPALLQGALADTRAYLSVALETARQKAPDVNVSDALKSIVEEYRSPQEAASAYRAAQRRTAPAMEQAAQLPLSLGKIFDVYIDPRTRQPS